MKLMTATAGAGALLAMGGLTIATSVAEPEPAPPGPVTPTEITTGETSVDQTVPATTPTTVSVAPEIVGPAPLPPGQSEAAS